jgi:hypothetical protein
MVLHYQNKRMSQEDVVRKVYGAAVDAPDDGYTMVEAINGIMTSKGEQLTSLT